MGSLAALIRLDGAPVDSAELDPILEALDAGSVRSRRRVVQGRSFAIGAVPLAGVRDSPLSLPLHVTPGGSRLVAFAGRIDNRTELLCQLALASSESGSPGDAELLAAGYDQIGDAIFDRIAGPFVAILHDAREGWLRLARDPLGGRTLFIHDGPECLMLASRPAALLASPRCAATPNECTIANYLAARGPRPGATFFREIEELPPGTVIRWQGGRRAATTTLALVPSRAPGAATDRDYEERFRELLDQAVDCAMPRAGSAAVLMSGGLDSTSVCATASALAARRGTEPPLAISWVFRELEGIDESPWIEAALRASGARSQLVVGDDLWPLAGEPTWPRVADEPFQDLYWRLHEQALGFARDAGCSVLMTGDSGDQLFQGGRGWFRDLLGDGRVGTALQGAVRAGAFALRGTPIAHPLRGEIGALLRRRATARRDEAPPWLTPWARARLEDESIPAPSRHADSTPASFRVEKLRSPYDLAYRRAAQRGAATFGIELCQPFRDRRLVELILGAPAHLLYRPGDGKRLLRRSMSDRLPPEVAGRRVSTSLAPLGERGLFDRAAPQLRAVLEAPDALWRRYVRPEWIPGCGRSRRAAVRDGLGPIVLWHCYCLERWRSCVEGREALHSQEKTT